jgi:hypothetical protein
MSETLEARVEAIRLAMSLEGSLDWKLKCAEKIYTFLEKGVTYPYPPVPYTYYPINVPYISTSITTNHE